MGVVVSVQAEVGWQAVIETWHLPWQREAMEESARMRDTEG